MPKSLKMVARILLGLVVLVANGFLFMWLGRLQLASMALQNALAQRGIPVRAQVTELDDTHIHVARLDFPGKSSLVGLDVGYALSGLRKHQLGNITLAGGRVFVQQNDKGWLLDGLDLTPFLPGADNSSAWNTGQVDLQELHFTLRNAQGVISGRSHIQSTQDDAWRIRISNAGGEFTTPDEMVGFSDTTLDMQVRAKAIAANLAGAVKLTRKQSGVGWQVDDSRLHVRADLLDNGGKWQGPIRMDMQLSGIAHPAVGARTMRIDGHGDIAVAGSAITNFDGAVTIQGNGVDLSRYGLVRQAKFLPDLDELLKPVLQRLDKTQKDLQVSAFSSVQYDSGQFATGDAATQITMVGEGTRLQAHLPTARFDTRKKTFVAQGNLDLRMPALGYAHIKRFQASGDSSELDFRTENAEAHVENAGRKLDIASSSGRMIRRPTRLYWSGAARIGWDGAFLQSRISDAVMQGRFGLDLQPGETRLSLLHGPLSVTADNVVYGDWRTSNAIMDIIPVEQKPVLTMRNQNTQVRAGIQDFTGKISKAELSDFTVDANATNARALLEFPAGKPAQATLSLEKLDLDLSGEQKPQIALRGSEIHAQHDLGKWQGQADLRSAHLQARDLPVIVNSEHPVLPFILDADGLQVSADSVTAALVPLSAFADMMPETRVRTNIRMGDGKVHGTGKTYLPGSMMELGKLEFDHDLASGTGTFELKNPSLTFRPSGLQPRQLLPSLAGLVANVAGRVNYRFHGAWSPKGLQETGGEMATEGMDFDLLLGRVEGVSGTMQFSSLLPLRTAAPAKIHVAVVDPGVELNDGKVVLAFNRDGEIDIERAHWPFADGEFYLQPMHWIIGGTDQKALLKVQNVDLLQLSGLLGLQSMSAKGRLSGDIPLHMSGNSLFVEQARLAAAPPGVLQYTGSVGNNASQAAPQAKLAFDVLKDLHYDVLELSLDGDVAGRMQAKLTLQGHNPDVLDGAPFLLRINTSAEFARLLRQATEGGRIAQTISTTLERAHNNKKTSGQNQP